MKKIYGFLGAAALLMTVACSKDGGEGAPAPDVKGDLYMTMTLTPVSTPGARTETEDEGKEDGKPRENKIGSALLLIATGGDMGYTVLATSEIAEADIVGSAPTYATSFKMARETLYNDIGSSADSKKYYLFTIVNPTPEIKAKYVGKTSKAVQDTFELTADDDTYWSMSDGSGKFLMTSASLTEVTILKSELAPGKHTSKQDALHLGDVEVQRTMSRFDLATGAANTVFKTESSNSTLANLTITFDGVALINMAKTANIFKEVGQLTGSKTKGTFDQSKGGTTAGYYGFFHKETKTVYTNSAAGDWTVATEGNYVFSPDQNGYLLSLFNGSGETQTNGTHVGHKNLTYTAISNITENDNSFTGGSDPGYKIWRYCMENTNYDKDNQVNGNTTGVVFRAKMELTNDEGEILYGQPVYAYNNVIIGDLSKLQEYVGNSKPQGDDNYEMIKARYNEAKEKNNGNEEVTTLNPKLVEQGFTIYEADNGTYYCYYTYWNRHNDNGNNALSNAMEFATVRNNVYKLAVNKITKLGHPGDPDNDPDPETPDTPDEKSEFWGEVTCKILPWDVRINDIEF